jgi:quinol monooxygenase YgiN
MSNAFENQVAVIAKLSAAPGKRDELVAALQVGLQNVESEEGTLLYLLHEDSGDADLLWFYELYSGQDAFLAHAGSDAFKALGATLAPLLGGRPELSFLKPLGGKGA